MKSKGKVVAKSDTIPRKVGNIMKSTKALPQPGKGASAVTGPKHKGKGGRSYGI